MKQTLRQKKQVRQICAFLLVFCMFFSLLQPTAFATAFLEPTSVSDAATEKDSSTEDSSSPKEDSSDKDDAASNENASDKDDSASEESSADKDDAASNENASDKDDSASEENPEDKDDSASEEDAEDKDDSASEENPEDKDDSASEEDPEDKDDPASEEDTAGEDDPASEEDSEDEDDADAEEEPIEEEEEDLPVVDWVYTQVPHYMVAYDAMGISNSYVDSGEVDGTYIIRAADRMDITSKELAVSSWNTQPDGSGKTYYAGDTITLTEDVFLYAQWVEISPVQRVGQFFSPLSGNAVNISYDKNSGYATYTGGGPLTDRANTDENYTIKTAEAAGVSWPGRVLLGWSTTSNGPVEYEVGQTFQPTEGMVLYAKWAYTTTDTYSVLYDGVLASVSFGKSGTFFVEESGMTPGDPYQVRDITDSFLGGVSMPENLVFDGWFTERNGQGQKYGAGETIPALNGNLILYASYSSAGLMPTVIYYGNVDASNMPATDYEYLGLPGRTADHVVQTGSTNQAEIEGWRNPGYKLVGWNTQKDGLGTTYYAGDTIYVAGLVPLYGVWEFDPDQWVTVIYYANNGTGDSDEDLAIKGEDYTLLANEFVRPGYSFVGWNTDQNATSALYLDEATISAISDDLTLYAVWSDPVRGLDKTSQAGEVAIGGAFTYTIKAYNNGSDVWQNVVATDELPEELTYNGEYTTNDGVTVSAVGNVLTINFGDIAANGGEKSVVITVVVNEKAQEGEKIHNTATVKDGGDGTDPEPPVIVDRGLDKTSQAGEVAIGGAFTYTIKAYNNGSDVWQNVVATDELPEELTYNGEYTTNDGVTVSAVGNVLTINFGDIAANGGEKSVVITVVVNEKAQEGEKIHNTATVKDGGDGTDPEPPVIVDRGLDKTSQAGEVAIGGAFTYTIKAYNNGSDVWQNVVATDELPEELTYNGEYTSVDGVTVSAVGNVLTINFGNIAAGEEKSVVITVVVNEKAQEGEKIHNTATVKDGGDGTDPEPPVIVDRGLDKTSQAGEVAIGGAFTYTIKAYNNGSDVWQNVVATDELPEELTYNGEYTSVDGVTVSAVGNVLTINFGNIAAGEEKSVVITVVVNEKAQEGEKIHNTATVKDGGDGTDPEPPVIVDRGLDKTSQAGEVAIGGAFTYTIKAYNNGSDVWQNVVATDELPEELTYNGEYTSADGVTVSAVGNVLTINFGDIAANGGEKSVVITVVVNEKAQEGEKIHNTATVKDGGDGTDPEPPVIVDRGLDKTSQAGEVAIGGAFTYTIKAYNNGSDVWQNVIATDELPEELTYNGEYTSADGVTVSAVGNVLTINFGDIAANGGEKSVVITVVVNEKAQEGEKIHNTATVKDGGDGTDPEPPVIVDRGLDKTSQAGEVAIGGAFTYTIKAYNNGSDVWQNVVATDELPEELTYNGEYTTNDGVTVSAVGNVLTINFGDIAANGGEKSVVITVVVNEKAQEGAKIHNTATVKDGGDGTDPEPPVIVDRGLDKTSQAGEVAIGGAFTYTIKAYNNGSDVWQNVIATDELPEELTYNGEYTSADGVTVSAVGNVLTINFGDIAANGGEKSVVITVVVNEKAQEGEKIHNTATVKDGGDGTDPEPPVIVDRGLDKTSQAGEVAIGGAFTYTIKAYNNGSDVWQNVIATDELPEELTYNGEYTTNDGVTVSAVGNVLTINFGDIAANGGEKSVVITVVVNEKAQEGAKIHNTATVKDGGDGTDPEPPVIVDRGLDKTSQAGEVAIGGAFTYTIKAYNNGSDVWQNVVATDELPEELTYNGEYTSADGVTVSAVGNVLTINFGDIAANGGEKSVVITVVVNEKAQEGEKIHNTATVKDGGDGTDPEPPVIVDRGLDKTSQAGEVAIGGAFTYTIKAYNNGSDVWQNVVATDELPEELTYNGEYTSADGVTVSAVGNVLTINFGDIAANGGEKSVVITVVVNEKAQEGEKIHNTATVKDGGDGTDPEPPVIVDRGLDKTSQAGEVAIGGAFTYTIKAYNNGSDVWQNVIATDELPEELTYNGEYTSADGVTVSAVGNVLTINFGDIAANGGEKSVVITVVVNEKAQEGEKIHNTATVKDGGDGTDPEPPVIVDRGLDKTSQAGEVAIGGAFTYTIKAYNNGSDVWQNVVATDELPEELTYNGEYTSADGVTVSAVGNVLTINFGDIAANGGEKSVVITVVVNEKAQEGEKIHNTATVKDGGDGTDPEPPVIVDRGLDKTSQAGEVAIGGAFTYTIKAYNNGSDVWQNVVATDELPEELTYNGEYTSADGVTVSAVGNVLTINFGDIAANGGEKSVVITVVVNEKAQEGEKIHNTATVKDGGDGTDPEPPVIVDRGLDKTSQAGEVAIGGAFTYTIKAYNNGSDVWQNVIATDELPEELTYNGEYTSADGVTVSAVGNVLTINFGDIAANGGEKSVVITVVVNEKAQEGEKIHNTATVKDGGDGTDPEPPVIVDRGLDKTSQAGEVAIGGAFTYTIKAYNNGSDVWQNVIATDELPEELTYNGEYTTNDGVTVSAVGNVLTINFGDIAANGGEKSVVITVVVNEKAQEGEKIHNTATVKDGGDGTDPEPPVIVDRGLDKTSQAGEVAIGGAFTYTIKAYNNGSDVWQNVIATDELPEELTYNGEYTSADGVTVSAVGNVLTINFGDIAANGGEKSVVITVVVNEKAQEGEKIHNTATVKDGGDGTDPEPPVIVDRGLDKTSQAGEVAIGGAFTYTIKAYNNGSDVWQNVIATDELPEELTYNGEYTTNDGVTVSAVGNVLTINFGDIAANGGEKSVVITVVVNEKAQEGEKIHNTATVKDGGDGTDPEPPVIVDRGLDKTSQAGEVAIGGAFTYTIKAYNNGSDVWQNVVATDELPEELTYNGEYTTNDGVTVSAVGNVLTINFGDIAANGGEKSVVITVVVNEKAQEGEKIHNTATVKDGGDGTDPEPPVIVDRGLDKTSQAGEVAIGGAFTYTIKAYNNGSDVWQNVVATDELPEELTYNGEYTSADGVTVSAVGNVLTINFGDIAANGGEKSVVITVVVNEKAQEGEKIHNTATVKDGGDGTDPEPPVIVDRGLDKTSQAGEVAIGGAFTYTIKAYNNGSDVWQNVIATDELPEELTYNGEYTTNDGVTVSAVGNVLTINFGDIAANGGEKSVVITVVVNEKAQEGEKIHNTATVKDGGDGTDPEPPVIVDRGLDKTSQAGEVAIGGAFTYTIKAYNNGSDVWQNVIATDELPEELTYNGEYTSVDGVTVSAVGNVLTINFGNIAAGEEKSVVITVVVNEKAQEGEKIHNTATVKDGGDGTDPEPPVIVDRGLDKTSQAGEVAIGGAFTYTIKAYNNGSDVWQNVVATDELPEELTYNGEYTTNDGVTVSAVGNVLTINFGDIAANGGEKSVVITVVVNEKAQEGEKIHNTATVKDGGDGTDPEPPVIVDRGLDKTSQAGEVAIGGAFTYTIKAYNNGSDVWQNVVATDELPEELTYNGEYTSADGVTVSAVGNVLTINFGDIAANGGEKSVVITVVVNEKAQEGEKIHNTATVKDGGDGTDPEPPVIVDRGLDKTSQAGEVAIGGAFTYTIKAYNNGSDVWQNVVATDELPEELTYNGEYTTNDGVTVSAVGNVLTINFGDIAANGGEKSVVITVVVNEKAQEGAKIHNTATVKDGGDGTDPEPPVIVDRGLDKTSQAGEVAIGGAFTYTIKAYNNGSDVWQNVVATDELPEELTYNGEYTSADGVTVSAVGNVLTINFGDIAANGGEKSVVITVVVNEKAQEGEKIHNTATVKDGGDGTDPEPPVIVDRGLDKTSQAGEVAIGGAFTYTIKAYNNGSDVWQNVVATDELPEELTYNGEYTSADGVTVSAVGNVLTINFGDIAANGGEKSVVITVVVNEKAQEGEKIHNTATVKDGGDGTDPEPPVIVDRGLDKTSQAGEVAIGGAFTYTIKAYNNGSDVWQNVIATDELPEELTYNGEYTSADGVTVSAVGNVLTINFGDIAANGGEKSVVITVVVNEKAQEGEKIHNTATVKDGGDGTDPEPPVIVDRGLDKTSQAGEVAIGGAFTYTIKAYNNGSDVWQNVVATDELPEELTYNGEYTTNDGVTVSAVGNVLTINFGDIAANGGEKSVVITVVVNEKAQEGAKIHNTATVKDGGDGTDPEPPVIVDRGLDKTSQAGEVAIGGAFTYTIKAYNNGSDVWQNVIATDELPEELTYNGEYTSADGVTVSAVGNVLTINFGDIAANGGEKSVVITVVVNEKAQEGEKIHNTATVKDGGDGTDPEPPVIVDRGLDKTSQAGEVAIGGAFTYTIKAYNNGSDVWQNVIATDELPEELTYNGEYTTNDGVTVSAVGNVLTINFGDIAANGGEKSVVITVVVNEKAQEGAKIHNTATVKDGGDGTDPEPPVIVDRGLDKTSQAGEVAIGGAFTYTIKAYNNGSDVWQNVVATDELPEELTYNGEYTSADGVTVSAVGNVLTINFGDIAANGGEKSVVITVVVNEKAQEGEKIHNTATVKDGGDGTDPEPPVIVDRGLDKTSQAGEVAIGGAFTYTIKAYNNGSDVWQNVVATDELPEELTYNGEYTSADGVTVSAVGNVLTINFGDIAANGGEKSVVITVVVNEKAQEGEKIHNTATVKDGGDGTDPEPPVIVDRGLDKTSQAGEVAIGGAFTYTIKAYNNGSDVWQNVIATDELPEELTYNGEYTSADGVTVSAVGNVLTINFGDIAANGGEKSVVITVVVNEKAQEGEKIHNTATVKDGGDGTDPEPPVIVDRGLDKTSQAGEVAIGGAFTYTIKAYNNGSDVWQNVVATDELPEELTYNGEYTSADGVTVSAVGNVLTINFGDIAANGGEKSVVITVVVNEKAQEGEKIHNTATVKDGGDGTDPEPPVIVDRGLDKTSQAGEVAIGGAFTYTIKAYNNGSDVWQNVIATDELPEELTYNGEYTSADGVTVSAVGNVLTINFGDIAANGGEKSVVITVVVNEKAQEGEKIHNTATVKDGGDGTDPEPPVIVDRGLDKTSQAGEVAIGGAFTYTIKAYNNGSDVWQNVVATDELPEELTYNGEYTTNDGVTVSAVGNVLTINFGDIAANGGEKSVVITVVVNEKAQEGAKIHNTATVKDGGDGTDPEPPVIVDRGLVKESSVTEVVAGGSYTYTITAYNNGTEDWDDVEAIDVLPDGLTYGDVVEASNGVTIKEEPTGTLTINFGTVGANGGQKTVVFTVHVAEDLEKGTSLLNTVTVKDGGDGEDPDPPKVGDGRLSKESSVSEVKVGESYTYTITARNTSTEDWEALAKDVLVDALTYDDEYFTEDDVVVTAEGNELTINFGIIKPGQQKSVVITVTVNENATVGEAIHNKVTVDDEDGTDPEPPVVVRNEILEVESSVDQVEVGDSYVYTITARNIGTEVWENVTVIDVLPDVLDYVVSEDDDEEDQPRGFAAASFTSEDGVTLVEADGTLTIDFSDIEPGTAKSISFIVRVNEKAVIGERIVNTVTAGLIVGTDPNPPIVRGETVYTITYNNLGGTSNANNPTTYKSSDPDIRLVSPGTRSGYTFDGWYLADRTTRITVIAQGSEGNLVLYAAWTANSGGGGGGGGGGGKPNTVLPEPEVPLTSFISTHYAYVIGYDDGTVRPEGNLSRAEASTVFFRLLRDEVRSANWTKTNDFSDVSEGEWYNNAVSVMANMGILNGYLDGSFAPNGSITRAELATIAAKFARLDNVVATRTVSFNDTAGHWAEEDILFAASVGWLNGYDDGGFRPDDQITRAEFMTLVNRMLKRVPETKDDLLSTGMITFRDNANDAKWYYLAVQEATNSHEHVYKETMVEGTNIFYETWTEILDPRDWSALEQTWSSATSAGSEPSPAETTTTADTGTDSSKS